MARSRDSIRGRSGLKRLKSPEKSYMHGAAKKDNAVAYCHHKKHKGTLSKGMVKAHGCISKECPYLERYETNDFWIHRKCILALKKYHKNGNCGAILVDGKLFRRPNENNIYDCARAIGKTGKVPEVVYLKDISYYCSEDL